MLERDIPAEDAKGIEMARQLFATQVASSRWRALLNIGNPTHVESALIMVGAKPSGSLRSFAAGTGVKLLSIDPEVIRRAMKTSDEHELKSIFDEALSDLPSRER